MLFLLTASCPRCGHKDFINLKIDDKKPKNYLSNCYVLYPQSNSSI